MPRRAVRTTAPETLQRAAELIRERAQMVLPVDATTPDGEITFTWAEQMGHSFNARVSPHFESFAHPDVAFAVADLLDKYAPCYPHVDGYAEVVAIARAYLGHE